MSKSGFISGFLFVICWICLMHLLFNDTLRDPIVLICHVVVAFFAGYMVGENI